MSEALFLWLLGGALCVTVAFASGVSQEHYDSPVYCAALIVIAALWPLSMVFVFVAGLRGLKGREQAKP